MVIKYMFFDMINVFILESLIAIMTILIQLAEDSKKRAEIKEIVNEKDEVEYDLKNILDSFRILDKKISSRSFHHFEDYHSVDLCMRAYSKLKEKINETRKNDVNWVRHSNLYVYFDNILEKLKELGDATLPSYDRDFYESIEKEHYHKPGEKIKRIENVFRKSTHEEKQLTLRSLERMIKGIKLKISEIIERNPEVLDYYGRVYVDKWEGVNYYTLKCIASA